MNNMWTVVLWNASLSECPIYIAYVTAKDLGEAMKVGRREATNSRPNELRALGRWYVQVVFAGHAPLEWLR